MRARNLLPSIVLSSVITAQQPQYLRPDDVNRLPSAPADHRIAYGDQPEHVADLRLPKGNGPFPVVVVIHGGCWVAKFADIRNSSAMADALRNAGLATWNIEYRRVDQPGGGWPNTFLDVARAVDHLRTIAPRYRLNLGRVITVGHSAGGHLALWAAARHRLPKDSPLFVRDPLPVHGVVGLAAIADLKAFHGIDRGPCEGPVVSQLMGGEPGAVPDRYLQGSPAELLPFGVPQVLVTGLADGVVPPELSNRYAALARKRGDQAEVRAIEGAAHHEVVAPTTAAWKVVEREVRRMAGLEAASPARKD